MFFETLAIGFALLLIVGVVVFIALAARSSRSRVPGQRQAPVPWTPPAGGYPPQQGAYYPPQQGAYYPPQQGAYYPPQQGAYYPPQQGAYPPSPQGAPTPPAVAEPQSEPSLEQTDLAATRRQLNRFAWGGDIAPGVHQQLKALIEAREASLGAATPTIPEGPDSPEEWTDPRQLRLAIADGEPEPEVTPVFTPASEPVTVPASEPVIVPASEPVTVPVSDPVPLTQPANEPDVEESAGETTPEPAPVRSPERAAPSSTAQSPAEPAPHRPLGQVLAAFMEERHIRWGEIIGGMLIVACSIALVVSLWSQIAGIPLIKFFLFTAVTSAFFGVGLYSAHHWKLPITSRGALIIAALLVPLTVLALAGFSRGTSAGDTMVIAGEVAAFGVFMLLLRSASRIIVPAWPGPLVLGVLGSSFTMVLIRRGVNADSAQTTLWLLGATPLAFQLAAIGWMLNRARRLEQLDAAKAHAVLIVVGTVCFAALTPLGLLIYKCGDVRATIHSLAPLVSLLGFPVLAAGLLLWRRVPGESLAGLRTAGTTVALIGGFAMLCGVGLAWPHPQSMLAATLLNFVTVTVVARVLREPRGHYAALPFLVLAGLTAFGVVTAVMSWREASAMGMIRALVGLHSGRGLLILAGVVFGASAVLQRFEHSAHARVYRIVSGVIALTSVVLLSVHGLGRPLGDAGGVSWIYALYALAAVGVAWRWWRPALWIASALVLMTLVQGMVFDWVGVLRLAHPLSVALVLYAAIVAAAQGVVRRRVGSPWQGMTLPLRWSTWAGLGLAGVVVTALWARTAYAASEAWTAEHTLPVVANLLLLLAVSLPWLWWRVLSAFDRDLVAYVSVFGLALVTGFGLGAGGLEIHGWLAQPPPGHGAWLIATYGLVAILVAKRFHSRVVASIAYLLVLLCLLQGFGHQWGDALGLREPWTWGLLVYASLAAVARWAFSRWKGAGDAPFTLPLTGAAIVGTSLATLWLIARLVSQDVIVDSQHSPMWMHLASWREQRLWVYLLWGTAAWGVIAWTLARRALVAVFQAVGYLAAAVGLLAALLYEPWFARSYHPETHPWTIQLLAAALGTVSVLWMILRRAMKRLLRVPKRRILAEDRVPLEHLVLLGVGFVGLLLTFVSVLPTVSRELFSHGDSGGPQAPLALAWRGWVLTGVLVIATALALAERVTRGRVLAALAVGLMPCLLLAGLAHSERAGGSALRWCLASYVLLGSALVWGRRRLLEWARRMGLEVGRHVARDARDALLWTLGPWLLLLSLVPVLTALVTPDAGGAAPGGVFGALPVWLSYLLPLLVIVAVLLVHAAQRQRQGLAVHATVTLGLAVAIAFLENVRIVQGGEALRLGRTWIRLGQWVVLAGSLAWLAGQVGDWWQRRSEAVDSGVRWSLPPAVLVLGVQLLLVVPSMVLLVVRPADPQAHAAVVGGVWGGLSTAAALAVVLWPALRGRATASTPVDLGSRTILAGALISAFAALVAAAATQSGWAGLYTLLAGLTLVSWLPLVDDILAKRLPGTNAAGLPQRVLRSAVLGVLVAALSLRGVETDPGRPWWAVGVLSSLALVACVHAVMLRRRLPLLLAGVAACVATSTGWITLHWSASHWAASLGSLTSANLIVLAAMGLLSVLLIRWMTERGDVADPVGLSLHFVALAVMFCASVVLVAVGLNGDLFLKPLSVSPALQLAGLTGTLLLAVGCLWSARTSLSLPLIFAAGLLLIGGGLDVLDLAPQLLVWSLSVTAAAYGLAAALVLRAGRRLQGLLQRLGAGGPPSDAPDNAPWLLASVLVLVGITLALGAWVQSRFGAGLTLSPGGEALTVKVALGMRLAPALAAALAIFGIGWNVHGRGIWWQRCTAIMTVLTSISLVWAWNEPRLLPSGSLVPWAQLLVLLGGIIAVTGVAVPRWFARGTGWLRACRPLLFGLGAAVVLAAGGIILVEWLTRRSQLPAPLGLVGVVAVALTLLGLAGLSIYFALRPERAPYGKDGPWLSAYVYLAEGLAALALLHLRLSLLRGAGHAVVRTWPFVVLVLAFVGVALGEVFRRRKVTVLAKPLERTGIFLPLLPVLSFWALESTAQYSSILLLAGLFYGVLAVARRSFGFGIIAAIAANGGLWNILHHTSGVGFLTHPQLWLIPLCVSLLAAAHFNRKQLSAVQMTTLRYACLTGVYVSSTVDLFINGVSSSPGLALVLSGLSVVGVLTGIALRVRSLLFLGCGFLVLSLLALIWQASTNLGWTWLWYVAGILLGVAIIVFFALFERKRRELQEVVDRLKSWEQ